MAYKRASDKAQARADRITLADFVKGGEDLSGEERLNMLRNELRKLELSLMRSETKGERKVLGKRKFVLQTELSRLRQHKRPGLESFFIEAARRILSKEDADKIWEEAKRTYDIYNRPKNDAVSDQTYLQAELLGVQV